MWQQQRAGKLQVPKTTEQGQCDILKSTESNEMMKLVSIDLVKNYSKLEMNDFICVLLDNERTKH